MLLVLFFKGSFFFFIIWSEFNGSEVFVEKEIAVALDWNLINKLCSQASGSGKSGVEEKSEKKLLVTSDLSKKETVFSTDVELWLLILIFLYSKKTKQKQKETLKIIL